MDAETLDEEYKKIVDNGDPHKAEELAYRIMNMKREKDDGILWYGKIRNLLALSKSSKGYIALGDFLVSQFLLYGGTDILDEAIASMSHAGMSINEIKERWEVINMYLSLQEYEKLWNEHFSKGEVMEKDYITEMMMIYHLYHRLDEKEKKDEISDEFIHELMKKGWDDEEMHDLKLFVYITGYDVEKWDEEVLNGMKLCMERKLSLHSVLKGRFREDITKDLLRSVSRGML